MEALEQIKAGQRAVWTAGDYPSMVEKISSVGERVVARAGIEAGERVLDVACGTGNATIPAARAGGRVTGLDLTPRLLEAGRAAAAEAGVEIEWIEGDAEDLPFEDGSFDVVMSVFGCMFAPRHDVTAAEIARVLRPGGRMVIASWTPEGATGDFFRTVGAHAPPPPPEVAESPPPLWGDEHHVLGLFEGTGVNVEFERADVDFEFDSVDDALQYFETKFGPVMMVKQALESEGKWEAARQDLRDMWARLNQAEGDTLEYPAGYLIAIGRKS